MPNIFEGSLFLYIFHLKSGQIKVVYGINYTLSLLYELHIFIICFGCFFLFFY
jgi:hypothetical protein